MFEPGGKAADWHIGESVESVEIDIEVLLQLPFVVCFKFCLVRREKVTIGIVNQVERKVSYATVTEPVQELKGADTGIEDAVAPLGIDVVEPRNTASRRQFSRGGLRESRPATHNLVQGGS